MAQVFINPFSFVPPVIIPQGYGQYSVVRKLNAAYAGSAFKVRRASDNATQDIGFSGSLVDSAACVSFCGASAGFIDTLYDQSGSSHPMTQPTTGKQPRIYDGSAMTTRDGFNVMQFDGSNDQLLTAVDLTYTQASTWFGVFSTHVYASGKTVLTGANATDFTIMEMSGGDPRYRIHMAVSLVDSVFVTPVDELHLASIVFDTTSTFQINNGVTGASFPGQTITQARGLGMGGHPGDFAYANCEISEFHAWNSVLGAPQIAAMQDNINSFYTIY